MTPFSLESSALGKTTEYTSTYTPSLLFPIPRQMQRDETPLPFRGCDIWNAYELSWLNKKGKPEIALAEFSFPCTSPNIIESKSFKLYLNSFSQTSFDSPESVLKALQRDLSIAAGSPIEVSLILPQQFPLQKINEFSGICLDSLDIETEVYDLQPEFLQTSPEVVEETLYSNLLKSNCLITNQPDWASVLIHYVGPQISHEGLLKYFISFRNHNEFHEHCIERIFMDIFTRCSPQKLTVYGRYTRRGGLDINPFRSNFASSPGMNIRQSRQ